MLSVLYHHREVEEEKKREREREKDSTRSLHNLVLCITGLFSLTFSNHICKQLAFSGEESQILIFSLMRASNELFSVGLNV